jgi:hypothetical protein
LSDYSQKYWKRRLASCRQTLSRNGFEAFCADNVDEARQVVTDTILPTMQFESVSWGDSLTLYVTGILEVLRQTPGIRMIDPFEIGVPRHQIIERRRQALLSDLFFSGTNAITDSGVLVNLDMVGNRIGGISFGPRRVVVMAGRNKIVGNTADAIHRIKHTAAPANAIRHENLRTPCRQTAVCMNCKGPDRICNTWSMIERSIPAGRIKVVLINEDCGL